MIWVVRKIKWIELSYQTESNLPAVDWRVDDDMIWVMQKMNWIEMILLVSYDERRVSYQTESDLRAVD